MRRNYISPEFMYQEVYGSYNMREQSSFFGSKMIDIVDNMSITNENLIYYQLPTGEQVDLTSERSLSPIVYDQSSDKGNYHTLSLVENQTDFLKNDNANWTITIDLKRIFTNDIFATLKSRRTFEGVLVTMTKDSDVNSAINKYIEYNIKSRYKFTRVEFFLEYESLLSSNSLKYGNKFDKTIEKKENIFTKFQAETEFDDSKVKLNFAQQKPAGQFIFKYYFNLYFEKL